MPDQKLPTDLPALRELKLEDFASKKLLQDMIAFHRQSREDYLVSVKDKADKKEAKRKSKEGKQEIENKIEDVMNGTL